MRSLLRAAILLVAMASPVAAQPVDVSRLVVAGGALTEIVYLLGAEDRIVAVDTTSLYPAAVDELPKVGYLRALSAEGVLSLRPTAVLATDDAGPPAVIEQIESAGVPVIVVPDEPTIDGVALKIERVAAALGLAGDGRALIDRIERDMAALAADVAGTAERPGVMFILSLGRGAPLAAGEGTAADAIIALAGGRNVLAGFEGYKPLSVEAAVAAAPDLILMMSQAVEEAGGAEAVLALDQLRLTPAARDGRLVAMDGLLLLGFGPRTPEAARALFVTLHPDRES